MTISYMKRFWIELEQDIDTTMSDRWADYPILECYNADPESLQRYIEERTLAFNERYILKEHPELIDLLISKELPPAKKYLLDRLAKPYYKIVLQPLGPLMVEAILIYALAKAFSCLQVRPVLRVDTLLSIITLSLKIVLNEHLKVSGNARYNNIARVLLVFMLERGWVSVLVSDNEKGRPLTDLSGLVVCDFDLSLLPLIFDLPMVMDPVDWKVVKEGLDMMPYFQISDVKGGYYCPHTPNYYDV